MWIAHLLTMICHLSKQNHMLFEVVKNSLRATVETHGVDNEDFPPIKVIVAEGSDDITIKVSDEVRTGMQWQHLTQG